jgi:hypothetical protein
MSNYIFTDKSFKVKNYDIQKTFSNFLPGVAGKDGLPIWVFYVNRGQGIASFGIKDKNNPILEFSPANIAYSRVNYNGFRTFLKIDGIYVEPFSIINDRKGIEREMEMSQSSFSINEINNNLNYTIQVTYFTLCEHNYPALVRKVEITNTSDTTKMFEICDGLSEILPFGLENAAYKNMGNLFKSWNQCSFNEKGILSVKLRSSVADSAEIKEIHSGNFYTASTDKGLLYTVADSSLIFGADNSKTYAFGFDKKGVDNIKKEKQNLLNEIGCAFSLWKGKLNANEKISIFSQIGTYFETKQLNSIEYNLKEKNINNEFNRSSELIDEITENILCKTNNDKFDRYIRQSFLDNVIRGGMPLILNNKKNGQCYYIYSRKHGDLERDYNWFDLEPQYYSSGNGNFRDVLQNRRNDIFFFPEIYDYNIKYFFSLIQLDGYNPLNIIGNTFTYKGNKYLHKDNKLDKILIKEFSFGELYAFCKNNNIDYSDILCDCEVNDKALTEEGYWTDHFIYLLDVLENFFKIYPDKKAEILFNNNYKYFYSGLYVLPRDEKTALSSSGKVRRYESIGKCKAIAKISGKKLNESSWIIQKNNKIYQTTLMSKIFNLLLIKYATLDSEGMGIDMEADKPGWNDAMNGLPALFGSSVAELIELKRFIEYFVKQILEFSDYSIKILNEQFELFKGLRYTIKLTSFDFYEKANKIKEDFRKKVLYGFVGFEKEIKISEIIGFFEDALIRINNGIEKAKSFAEVIPTFVTYDAISYEKIQNKGINKLDDKGNTFVHVKKFIPRVLPAFLEAPAKYLKLNLADSKDLYQKVKQSEIYDKELNLYKTSESLRSESMEIGRIRSFVSGWLERESCFLHLSYKYLLGLLYAELYEEFYNDIKTNLVYNFNADVYGRSTLENSSFIATSNHLNESKRGQGFQPRLTGANAEIISIYVHLMAGSTLFTINNGELRLVLKPILHKNLFKNNKISFTLFGKTKINYFDKRNNNNYINANIGEIELISNEDEKYFDVGEIKGIHAEMVRNGAIKIINAEII